MIKLDEIKKIEYFKGLNDEDLVSIAARIVEKSYGKGENIAIEGISCKGIYIVSSGRVKVFKTSVEGREHIFYYARRGDVFCDVCLFMPRCNPLSATSTVPTVIYFIGEDELKNLILKIPSFAMKLLEHFSQRMNQYVEMIEDLSFKNVPARLAKILVDFAEKEGVKKGDNMVLKRDITLYEMASMVGTVREVITRSLQKLEKEGVIKIDRSMIEVTDMEQLRDIAGEY
jgi:CRP/FNR family transcriptional regulator, cyclic AMP receptor protein